LPLLLFWEIKGENKMENKNAQHTPGPWHVGVNPGPMIYGPNGEQVADLSGDLLPKDERAGNIRLIAAAPELLAVAKKLHHTYGRDHIGADQCEFCKVIAKAKGRGE
jgi:hypothetical protein